MSTTSHDEALGRLARAVWEYDGIPDDVIAFDDERNERLRADYRQDARAYLDPSGYVALVAERDAVLALHKPRPEEMLDEDADDEVRVEVMVCAHCFHLVYPEGSIDQEYADPDVFWPCPTARAAGIVPLNETEGGA